MAVVCEDVSIDSESSNYDTYEGSDGFALVPVPERVLEDPAAERSHDSCPGGQHFLPAIQMRVLTSRLSKDTVELVVVVDETVEQYALLPELATEGLRVGVPRVLSPESSVTALDPPILLLTDME